MLSLENIIEIGTQVKEIPGHGTEINITKVGINAIDNIKRQTIRVRVDHFQVGQKPTCTRVDGKENEPTRMHPVDSIIQMSATQYYVFFTNISLYRVNLT